jgi:hypothetical protein
VPSRPSLQAWRKTSSPSSCSRCSLSRRPEPAFAFIGPPASVLFHKVPSLVPPSRLASVLLGLSPVAQPHEMISEVRPRREVQCSSGFRSSALSPRFSWFPTRCPPKGLGAPSAPLCPGVARLRRTLSEAHAPRTNTAVSISTRPPRSRVADSDPCVNGSRDRRASPTRHIEDNRIRRCASGLGCDHLARAFASVVRIAFAPWSAFACWDGHQLAMPTSMPDGHSYNGGVASLHVPVRFPQSSSAPRFTRVRREMRPSLELLLVLNSQCAGRSASPNCFYLIPVRQPS